jgi:hypothetical protein
MHGVIHQPHEKARHEEGEGDGGLAGEMVGLQEQIENPPYAKRTPTKLNDPHRYDMESTYLAPRGHNGTVNAYKKCVYMTIHTIWRAVAGVQEMRVRRRWPHIENACVWKNLSDAPVPDSTRINWYRVIHELIPTNERLR